MDLRIVQLHPANDNHGLLVSHLILTSELCYADDPVSDTRFTRWMQGRGDWAVAIADGHVAALVMLDGSPDDAELVWLEVRPQWRGRGLARALWTWCQERAQAIRITSVRGALEMYAHLLGCEPSSDGRFTWVRE